jgi:type IV pilus assembly protein PilX
MRHTARFSGATQRGVVMLFVLIALLVMLVGGMALVQSFNASLFTAGNMAFKRDLLNQGERVVPVVLQQMEAGVLAAPASRGNHMPNANYSASILPTNARGIPLALLSDDAFAAVGIAGNDIDVSEQRVAIRYVVDRMCSSIGLDTALGPSRCTLADNNTPMGGSSSEYKRAEDSSAGGSGAVAQSVVYRLSIRVTGPRATQAFYQTTFTL